MDKSLNFDSATWIKNNVYNCGDIYPETIEAISNFTIMWNFFENYVCNKSANIKEFERFIDKIIDKLGVDEKIEIDDYLSFWVNEYCNYSGYTPFLDGFCFRPYDKRDIVENVFNRNIVDTKSKLLVSMILIYRLRNNLFHGIKATHTFNSQVENLNISSYFISILVDFCKRLK